MRRGRSQPLAGGSRRRAEARAENVSKCRPSKPDEIDEDDVAQPNRYSAAAQVRWIPRLYDQPCEWIEAHTGNVLEAIPVNLCQILGLVNAIPTSESQTKRQRQHNG